MVRESTAKGVTSGALRGAGRLIPFLLLAFLTVFFTSRSHAVGGSVIAWGSNQYGETNVPASATNIVALAAGSVHTLALTENHTLLAWGASDVIPPPGTSNLVTIAAGGFNSMGIRPDRSLWLWSPQPMVTNVPASATNLIKVSAGNIHVMALRADGRVIAWGDDFWGATDVPKDATNIVDIATGGTFSVGLRSDGAVLVWGLPGRFGLSISNVVSIAATYDACLALRSDGRVFVWDSDSGLSNIVAVAGGGAGHWLALRNDGTVLAIGSNSQGQSTIPSGLSNVSAIAAGGEHSLALVNVPGLQIQIPPGAQTVLAGENVLMSCEARGTMPLNYVWTRDDNQVAQTSMPFLLLPDVQANDEGIYRVTVRNATGSITSGPANITVVATSPRLYIGVTNLNLLPGASTSVPATVRGTKPIGVVWQKGGGDVPGATNPVLALSNLIWTDTGSYRLIATNGLGTTESDPVAITVVQAAVWGSDGFAQTNVPSAATNLVAIAVGGLHTLVLHEEGTVLAWGDDSSGQCNVPPTATNAVAVAAGEAFSMALSANGVPLVWGDNSFGQTNIPSTATNVNAVSAGRYHCLALKEDGTVTGWGYGANDRTTVPTGTTNVISIAAGGSHSLALRANGTIVAWGLNDSGQTTVPLSATNVKAIAAGGNHSLALKADGNLMAWGDNSSGQCNVPVGASNLVSIAANGNFSMALRTDGHVIGWGDSSFNRTTTPQLVTNVNAIASGAFNGALVDRGELSLYQSPSDRNALAGDDVVLLAAAFGKSPVGYQWLYNGFPIVGATNAWLVLPNVQELNAGDYAVVATSGLLSQTNHAAAVTVVPSAPIIVEQPTNRLVLPGAATTFTVSALGTAPLSFQWKFNGANITNATNSMLTLTNVQLVNGGDYQVIIANSIDRATSAVARLDIYPFNLFTVLTNAEGTWSADWGDYDNDGRLDLLVGGKAGGQPGAATAHLFRNLGSANFTEVNAGFAQSAQSVAWGDFDNDGFLDILFVTSSDAKIWHNNGNGTFTNLGLTLTADFNTVASLADFDSDGRLDILLGGRLYRNLGNNQFINVSAGLPTTQYSTTAWGDYDSDGRADVLICGLVGGNSQFRLYRNLGNGTFTNVNAGFQDIYRGMGTWLDFDGDGRLDVLMSGQTGPGVRFTALYRNNGDGTFTYVSSGLPATSYAWLAIGDSDNDGQPDVFLSGDDGTNSVGRLFRGQTNGSFVQVVSPFPTELAPVASWGDYDWDGRLDLALSTLVGGQPNVGLYRNDATVTNTPPTPPSGLATGAGVNSVTFNWGAGNDGQTPASALTYGLRVARSPGANDILTPDAATNGTRRLARPGNAGSSRSMTLTNLAFGRYYWAVQSVDSAFAGSTFTPEQVFAYAAATLPATAVTSSEATLNGSFDTNALPATAFFEWGINTNYGSRTSLQALATNTSVASVGTTLTGLLPGTIYHYRFVLSNLSGTFFGGDASFVTIDVPKITPQTSTAITSSGATLNTSVNPSRGATWVNFEYGLSQSYGNATTATNIGNGSIPIAVSQRISGLLAGRVYHFRVFATNSAGLAYGPDQTFQTTTEPTVTTTAASQVGTTTANLNALVNANGLNTMVAFEYGPTTAYGNSTLATNIGNATNAVSVMLPASGLTAATLYHYRVVATNSSGPSLGGDVAFQTLSPFTIASNAFVGAYIGQSSFVDYNDDGLLDIHITGTDLVQIGTTNTITFSWLYRNEGNGSFVQINPGLPGIYWGTAVWGDYDNDGYQDVAIAGYFAGAALARIYRNNGDGTFSDIHAGLTPVGYAALAWGDFNNDGRLDLLLTGNPGGQLVSQVYRNEGNGVFTNVNAGLVGVYQGSVAWGDYNNDGWLDILFTGDTGAYTTTSRIYRNNGNGTFTDIGAAISPAGTSSAAWGDYNNDGRLDILLTGSWNTFDSGRFTQIYRNDGNGVFTALNPNLPAVRYGSVAWGDYDNDGLLDVLLTGYGSAAVYRNNGNDTFSNAGAGLIPVSSSSAAWGDYDRDGRLDILVSGDTGSARISRLYHNQNSPTNSPPLSPTNLVASTVDGNIRLTWATTFDTQTSASGLTYNLRIGTTPGGEDILSAAAALDGTRRIVHYGNAGHATQATITRLNRGAYYWSVQAIDTAFAGSAFATEQPFVIPPLTIAATLNATNAIQIDFAGNAGAAYSVFVSTNLVQWLELGAATEISSNSFRFVDWFYTNYPARFYRVWGP